MGCSSWTYVVFLPKPSHVFAWIQKVKNNELWREHCEKNECDLISPQQPPVVPRHSSLNLSNMRSISGQRVWVHNMVWKKIESRKTIWMEVGGQGPKHQIGSISFQRQRGRGRPSCSSLGILPQSHNPCSQTLRWYPEDQQRMETVVGWGGVRVCVRVVDGSHVKYIDYQFDTNWYSSRWLHCVSLMLFDVHQQVPLSQIKNSDITIYFSVTAKQSKY